MMHFESLEKKQTKLQNTKNLTIHTSYYWDTFLLSLPGKQKPSKASSHGDCIGISTVQSLQPALLVINVVLQSPRQVLKSSFPVSTIVPHWLPESFSLPLSLVPKVSWEGNVWDLAFKASLFIKFQQLQSLQPTFIFIGSVFCLKEFWIASISGKTSTVQLALK